MELSKMNKRISMLKYDLKKLTSKAHDEWKLRKLKRKKENNK